MSLVNETIDDLALPTRYMNRQEKRLAQRGNKERARGSSSYAMYSRKATDQKKSLLRTETFGGSFGGSNAGAATVGRPKTFPKKMRRQARRGEQVSSVGATTVGQIKLSKLRKGRAQARRAWPVEAQSNMCVLDASSQEQVRWKGKAKNSRRDKCLETFY